jgi:hypothetical protein
MLGTKGSIGVVCFINTTDLSLFKVTLFMSLN